MDGASKKRKLCQDDLDEENEEEKIEKFFALIKGLREARDRLMKGSDPSLKVGIIDTKNKKIRKLEEEKKQVITTVWKPSFLREDFMEDNDQKLRGSCTPAAVVSTLSLVDSSQSKEVMIDEKHHENKESLDLDLSL